MSYKYQKQYRLPGYDYSQNRYYFVTICTKLKENVALQRSYYSGINPPFLIRNMNKPHKTKKKPKVILDISAGGIIYEKTKTEPKILLIKTEKRWTLPKGQIEKEESLKDAAKREVSEETGLKHLKTEEKIGQEHYFFKMEKEKNILHNKFVHYFLFKFVGKEKPKLQKEEGFVEFKWVSFRQAKKKIEYKETRKILEKAEEILKGPRQKNLLPNATSS
ncbi:hypothetical protein COY23_04335 [bacterium (Candidatus Torokbacteria) CG_4_10_14_0_2_um_filter_35_8]|nr:MAG: hypothetical protein COY23_04335 [bacterium (Candidatus Torokbacteria) CG_4_10_14_0_2_um_filter_35_8]